MKNEENTISLLDEIIQKKDNAIKITADFLYEQKLAICNHIVLCLDKKEIVKEIDGVNIVKPLFNSIMGLRFIMQVCNFSDDEIKETYTMRIVYDKEKINTTKDKLEICLYLINEMFWGDYENVKNFIKHFCNNGFKFDSTGIDKCFLLASITNIYTLIQFIREIYSVSFDELNDCLDSYKKLYQVKNDK